MPALYGGIMKVTLNEDYKVAPEGHTTLHLKKGEEVEGVVADMAVRDGKAKKPTKRGPKPSYTKPAQPDHEG